MTEPPLHGFEEEAVERIEGSRREPLLLSCEHASARLPSPWSWLPEDLHLRGTHWAFDLGAAELTRELAEATFAPAILSRFSRLLIDPNRPEDSEMLIVAQAEAGAGVELNRAVDPAERALRIERYHRPYHAAVDESLASTRAEILLSIHSFTDRWDGVHRPMEIGVLFDREEPLAERLARALTDAGFVTALNEPYSGRAGLIYAAERHASTHGRRALELEVRQDLCVAPAFRARLVEALAAFF